LFRAKAQRFGGIDGDACGCRDPLDGVDVAILSSFGLRVKILDHCGLGNGGGSGVATFLGALSWSPGLLSLITSLVASSVLLSFLVYL
jgi:hypothetical protein